MRLENNLMKVLVRILYYLSFISLVIIYIFFPLFSLIFDIVDGNSEFREIFSFALIPFFIVLRILSTELPSLIYKFKIQSDGIFSIKRQNNFFSTLFSIYLIAFIIESIVMSIVNKISFIDKGIALSIVLEVFLRITIKISYINRVKIK